MAQFPTVVSALDGKNGFVVNGVAAYDNSGWAVSGAGDVNADGYGDLVIGAPDSDLNGSLSGAAYVVFGRAGGFNRALDLSALDGRDGFALKGAPASSQNGFSVASAGDVNGDGFGDFLTGAFRSGKTAPLSGASYLVFGKATGFPASLDLSKLTGRDGVRIDGVAQGDLSGDSVSSAGDVNGDGFDDLLIGAPGADPGETGAGTAYVVFGHTGGFGRTFKLSALNGSNGFALKGQGADDASGSAAHAAGDVNGDGFADLIVGAPGVDARGEDSGAAYVVFGGRTFAAATALSSLNGRNGFKLVGEAANDFAGISVQTAGDVNGDGFADLIVGTGRSTADGHDACIAYVVFGRAGGFAGQVELSGLKGRTGFALTGIGDPGYSGLAVSSAGDVNGDGFDDVLVGASGTARRTGTVYVVFGKPDNTAQSLDLSGLTEKTGFIINGETMGDDIGVSASAAGDINGDGFSDIAFGADGASPHGLGSGATYVVFGRAPDKAVARVGSAADQTISGGRFADKLSGLGGDDTLVGNGGNDRLDGGRGADTMIGGAGNDTFIVDDAFDAVVEAKGQGIDTVLAGVSFRLGFGVENLTLTGSGLLSGVGNGLNNRLTGNAKANVLTGGGGADTFVFDKALGKKNVDKITDFAHDQDRIALDNAIFKGLAEGTLAAKAFYAKPAAHDRDDRVLYDKKSGALFFDSDGNKPHGHSPVQFATLSKGLMLDAGDFLVI